MKPVEAFEKRRKYLNQKIRYDENRDLFNEYLDWHAYKLKRKNNLREIDEGCLKTLLSECSRLLNVEAWFDKPLRDITREDIKRVYDGLEDGEIKNRSGKPYKGLDSYYNKLFKSKLFEMIGKADLAREVIEFSHEKPPSVRFIREADFRKIADRASRTDHKALLWLAYDIGENVQSLLMLEKRHLRKRKNPDTNETEYLITLQSEHLKRSRTPRTEPTRYHETVEYLDTLLREVEGERLFSFGYRMAKIAFDRLAELSGVKTEPDGTVPTWKDLRSSMACDCLMKGWTTDEVKARLGHKPSSTVIDRYVNYLALDRRAATRRTHQANLEGLQAEIEELKHTNRLMAQRHEQERAETEPMRMELEELKASLQEMSRAIRLLSK